MHFCFGVRENGFTQKHNGADAKRNKFLVSQLAGASPF